MVNFRIGHGYDVHKLVKERRLILGGVEIEHELGLLGHSDADVLVHAVMDALIGAMGAGDIGKHFPDTDDKYEGISSISLLSAVYGMLVDNGFSVVNIDATVIAQKPKLQPFIEKMRANIAFALNISVDAVNIKATTEEHLGFTGREEGISAHAVALIEKNKAPSKSGANQKANQVGVYSRTSFSLMSMPKVCLVLRQRMPPY